MGNSICNIPRCKYHTTCNNGRKNFHKLITCKVQLFVIYTSLGNKIWRLFGISCGWPTSWISTPSNFLPVLLLWRQVRKKHTEVLGNSWGLSRQVCLYISTLIYTEKEHLKIEMLTRHSLLGPFLYFFVKQFCKAQTKAEEAALYLSAFPAASFWGCAPQRCPQLQPGCSWILLTPFISHSLFALKYQVRCFISMVNLPFPLGKAVRCKMTWNMPEKKNING